MLRSSLSNRVLLLVAMVRPIGRTVAKIIKWEISKSLIAMKRFMKFMLGIAVAAISFTGCENGFDDPQPENVGTGLKLTVVADDVSRTEYDAVLDGVKWSAGDKASVFVNGLVQTLSASIDEDDPRIASFTYDDSSLTVGTAIVGGSRPEAFGSSRQYLGNNCRCERWMVGRL